MRVGAEDRIVLEFMQLIVNGVSYERIVCLNIELVKVSLKNIVRLICKVSLVTTNTMKLI